MNWLARLRPDNFTLALLVSLTLATAFPCQGEFAEMFGWATSSAIALLFFLHGARISRPAIIAGLTHWRLHATVLAFTFGVFPLLGLMAGLLPAEVLPPALATGLLFLACLPSTVQSSIAFTSIAGGNVPAAVCSASASSLLGIFVTPLLVALLMRANGGISLGAIRGIVLQLLVPFLAGHLLQPRIGDWAKRNKTALSLVDRGSILMVVYGAFSEAVTHGLWHTVTPGALAALAVVEATILATVLAATGWTARRFGFNRADAITILFCGSKKSLAAGVPIAGLLFPAASAGMMVLPLMLFHQMQLMVCAVLARRLSQA